MPKIFILTDMGICISVGSQLNMYFYALAFCFMKVITEVGEPEDQSLIILRNLSLRVVGLFSIQLSWASEALARKSTIAIIVLRLLMCKI